MNLWQEVCPTGVAQRIPYWERWHLRGKGVPCTWLVTGETSEVSLLLRCTECARRSRSSSHV